MKQSLNQLLMEDAPSEDIEESLDALDDDIRADELGQLPERIISKEGLKKSNKCLATPIALRSHR